MAIDTKSLSQLIAEFRKLQTKDSITPESLGYILQRIADLLATAGTSETQAILGNWYNALSKVSHTAVCKLQQGPADRNFVRLSNTFIDLLTGQQMTNENATIINMATTERAGAMKAQQVVDLNNARRAVADIQKILETVQAKLGMTDGSKGLYNSAQIQVTVENGVLRLYGAQQLVADGYVPYLFRLTRKRNPWRDKVAIAAGNPTKKYCEKRKGWNLFGTYYMVKIATGNIITFSTNQHFNLCRTAQGYSNEPTALVKLHTRKDGTPCIGWGRSVISLLDPKNPKKHRMIRLRFAIGFAKKILPGRSLITTANLVSSLAEFSVIYNPSTKTWHFGK
nr:MAG TPA: hypothetical protein [Caudoviricetes sp.]